MAHRICGRGALLVSADSLAEPGGRIHPDFRQRVCMASLSTASLPSTNFYGLQVPSLSVCMRFPAGTKYISCSLGESLVASASVSDSPTTHMPTNRRPRLSLQQPIAELPLSPDFDAPMEPLDGFYEPSDRPHNLAHEENDPSPCCSDFLVKEISRRRNFAIISHPDAGKTTLTEKLLLYGGAIHEAGAVKARRAARHATSDWMELEKQRGISITSTALVFETDGHQITLLDTPGHQDFGEDTYRTLAAADNAVMLVDAGKGLETQTRKLFEVCRMRELPIFTFINKMDRPALQALELLDQIEKEFGLLTHAVNWPIGSGERFMGLYYRPSNEVHLFERDQRHGSKEASVQVLPWGDPCLQKIIPEDLYKQLEEEIELLEAVSPPLDLKMIHQGELSPVFFGSAMNNFGVELFLESFLNYAQGPGPHVADVGLIEPDYPEFTGFVFKLQANMDPKHRDKVAFVRVCSGQFTKGMKVQLARTGRQLALTRPQKMFAQDRMTIETGFAGDVIGLNNPNTFAIGDTIYTGSRVVFPGIPSFSPELFSYLRNPNPSKYKQFQKGLMELLGEGAIQVLYSMDSGRPDPILAAVGHLQFEVLQYRMLSEYGVEVQLEPLGYSIARWVTGGWPVIQKAGKLYNCATVKDSWGRPVLLFRNEWSVSQLMADNKEIGELTPYALPPSEEH